MFKYTSNYKCYLYRERSVNTCINSLAWPQNYGKDYLICPLLLQTLMNFPACRRLRRHQGRLITASVVSNVVPDVSTLLHIILNRLHYAKRNTSLKCTHDLPLLTFKFHVSLWRGLSHTSSPLSPPAPPTDIP